MMTMVERNQKEPARRTFVPSDVLRQNSQEVMMSQRFLLVTQTEFRRLEIKMRATDLYI